MQAVKTTAVTCPGCGLSRPMDLSRLPDNVHQLVCPKCRRQFDLSSAVTAGENRYYRLRKPPGASGSRKPKRPVVIPAPVSARPAPVLEKRSAPSPEPVEEPILLTIDEEPEPAAPSGLTSRISLTAPPAPPLAPGRVPWEGEGGFLSRYILTVLKILFGASGFFKSMLRGQGYKLPRKFAVSTIAIVSLVWAAQYVITSLSYGEPNPVRIIPMIVIPVILWPAIYSILIFLQAAFYFFLFRVFKVVDSGYQAVFRLVAYSTAAKLWLIAPPDFLPVPIVWTTLLYYLGIKSIAGKKPGVVGIVLCILIAVAEIYGLSSFWHYLLYNDISRLW